jgi:hypothetical protein
MKNSRKPMTIRHYQGEGDEAGKWIATIDHVSEFRVVADTFEAAIRAAYEYAGAVQEFGEKPNPLLIEHRKEPSLTNWLACRRAGLEPSLPNQGGFKWLGNSSDVLDKHGISEKEFTGLLDAQSDDISKVCLHLLESIARSDQLKKQGKTHLARRDQIIPFEIIDWLIHVMLDGLDWCGIDEIPYDLKALIRFRLIPGLAKVDVSRILKENRFRASMEAGRMIAMGKTPSFRSVAATLEVEPSTVKRWFKSVDEFQRKAESLSRLFDPDGLQKSLFEGDRMQTGQQKDPVGGLQSPTVSAGVPMLPSIVHEP